MFTYKLNADKPRYEKDIYPASVKPKTNVENVRLAFGDRGQH